MANFDDLLNRSDAKSGCLGGMIAKGLLVLLARIGEIPHRRV